MTSLNTKQHSCFGESNDLCKSDILILYTHIIYIFLGSNTFIPIILCLLFTILNWEFYFLNTLLKDHYSHCINTVYQCPFWKKTSHKDLTLRFVIALYTFAVSHTYVCFILSLIIPHPWRKTVSWVMSNNFVIKCCSVCIERLSALMNGSMPYNHSWLTFCSRPCCHLLLFFLPDAS